MATKVCKKCLREKEIEEFYVHRQMADGRLSKCKDCTRKDVTENRNANLEYYRQYDRLRYDRGEHASANDNSSDEYRRRWYLGNRHKIRARRLLRRAVANGSVIKPEACQSCGIVKQDLEAHHEDYSKPLDVKWLCTRCHGATRKKPRTISRARGHRGGHYAPMRPTRAFQ